MSVVVRMEMPRNCHECPVSYMSFGDTPCWCKLAFEKNEAVSDGLMWREVDPQTRPDWCPIICSLPEGHGRLVSEKDVRWAIDDIIIEIAERIGHVPMTKNETMEYVNQLPTIVPAERSET